MSELSERVAKAIWNSLEGDTHSGGGWDFQSGNFNLSNEQKDRFRKMARAAMRECAAIAGDVRISANGHPQIDAPTPGDMQRAIVAFLEPNPSDDPPSKVPT